MKSKGIPKYYVYLMLVLAATVPLFFKIPVPGKPTDASIDAFAALMKVKKGDTVLIASDWTGSTRGESKAHMKAILRILMRKGAKIAIWSSADPQSPRVALDVMSEANKEREKEKDAEPYVRWNDWVMCGYYPNSDVAINAVGTDIRKAFATGKDTDTSGTRRSVFESPVMSKIKSVRDFALVLNITASKTSDFHVQFMSAKGAKLVFAVTGVMVPETQVFYNSGQCIGFIGGLQGVFDVEKMMGSGVNVAGPDGKVVVSSEKVKGEIKGFTNVENEGNGTRYYPTLHFALILMIALIIKGNIEMVKAKKGGAR